jgi:hypothetical protein
VSIANLRTQRTLLPRLVRGHGDDRENFRDGVCQP